MKWFVLSLICFGVVATQHQPPFLAFQQQIPQQVPSSANVRFPAEPHWQFRSGIPQNVQWSEPEEFLHTQSQAQPFQQFQPFQPQMQQRIPQQVHQQQTRSAQEFQPQRTRTSQQFQRQPQQFQPQQPFQQFRNVPVAAPIVPTTQRQVVFRTEPVPVVRQPSVPVAEPVLAPVQGQSQNRVPQREGPTFTTIRHVPSTEFMPQRHVISNEAQVPHTFAPVQHLQREPITAPVTEIATEPEPITEEVQPETRAETLRGEPTLLPEAPAIIHAVFAEPTTVVPFEPEAEEISTEETVDNSTVEEIVDNTVQPLEAIALTTAPLTTTTMTVPTTTTTTTEPTTTTTEATTIATTTTTVATSSRRSYSSKKSGFKPRTTTTEKPELNSLPTRTPNSAFSRFSSGGGYKSNCGCVRMLACQRLQISINRCNESEGFMYCCGSKEIKDESEVKEAKARALKEAPISTTTASTTSTTETGTETEAVEVTTVVLDEA